MQALNTLTSPEPLSLTLVLSDGSALVLQTAVRVVPQKRIVCLAQWNNQAVYAKLFLGEKAARYAARDAKGAQALSDAQLLTPSLLFNGEGFAEKAPDCRINILLFKAHLAAENVQVLYDRASTALKKALAVKLVKTLAQHHQANLVQTDLYFKNFLIEQGDVLTIDGDGMRKFTPLSTKKALDNLAVLLSKIDVLDLQAWLPDLVATYQAQAHIHEIDPEKLFARANDYRLKAARDYADKKVFRQCTDVQVKQSPQLFSAIASDFAALSMAQSINEYDAIVKEGEWLKQGNTCSVVLAQFGHCLAAVKRYNIKSVGHAISRLFRPSRASQSWGNAHRLQLLGLPTPQPMALMEQRYYGWLRGKAFFVSRFCDALDSQAFFAATTDSTLRAEAVKQLVQLCYRLYLLHCSHGDLKASNIKILADGKPVLIDLDSMLQHRSAYFAYQAHVRDLKRLMQNWQSEPTLYNALLKNFKVVYQNHAPLQAAGLLTT